jgi:hypothetical protein
MDDGNYVVLSSNYRDYCDLCCRKSIEEMQKCNHITYKVIQPHKSMSNSDRISYIYKHYDADELNKQENENISNKSFVPAIDPILLENFFNYNNFLNDSIYLSKYLDNVKIVLMSCDPNGGGLCDYAVTISYLDVVQNISVVIFFFFKIFKKSVFFGITLIDRAIVFFFLKKKFNFYENYIYFFYLLSIFIFNQMGHPFDINKLLGL